MNPIELSKEQKDKLLEMCRKLFPEYFTDDYNYWSIEKDYIIYWKYDNIAEWSEPIIKIHWFEFCMTHLRYKLNDIQDKEHYTIEDIYQETKNIHPVDYLYKEFKKIK